jgi:peptidoglycan/xylan/chitin deacetylase (PgdA/CDA1 family)
MSNQRLVILNLHGIGYPVRAFWPNEQEYWVQKPFYEEVLDLVNARPDVAITFDDSNVTDYEVALPALQARGIKAHFYVVWGFVGRRGFLSQGQLRELHASGMIIGNHGHQHRSWRGLSDSQLQQELVEARDRLEQLLSAKVRYAACPNGSYDRRVLSHLRACGYERVFTSDRGCTRGSDWLQARNTLVRQHDLAAVELILNSKRWSGEGLLRLCKRTVKRWR